MKVLVISLVCALIGGSAGSAPFSHPSPLVRTVVPPQFKGFAYSSSQYINSVPSAAYSVGLQPQFAYQVPLSGLTSVHSAYYPFASPSIYPTNVYLTTIPGVAPIPLAPAPVAPLSPEAPSQMNSGDADTTVVESADQPKSQEASSTPTSAPSKLEQMFQPANTFPNFPSIPQIPQLQESPQDSQSNFPQFPQPSSDDDFSQGPGAAPPSFLGDNGGNKGFNDEDTVSVESA